MAEKPRFIYINKKKELVWEIPGLGPVSVRDERHPRGAHGEIVAYLKHGGKEYKVGRLSYTMGKGASGKQQLRASEMFVNYQFRNNRIADMLYDVAEKSAEEVVHLDLVSTAALKISRNKGYKIYRDPEQGFWSMTDSKERERWLKVPKAVRDKKRIKRR